MISYELAKELKDTGYDQVNGENGILICECSIMSKDGKERGTLGLEHEKAYVPTLSELIEACGEKFFALVNKKGIWIADGGEYIGGLYGNEFCIEGKTPEEAVSRLWLALHKNRP